MPNSVEYYLLKGYDRPAAEYFAAGRKRVTAVQANPDFTLTLEFDNCEKRIYDCKQLLEQGIFKKIANYSDFKRVYLDENHCIAWDIDPNVDSNIVWSNKIDLCPDSCYIDSKPI